MGRRLQIACLFVAAIATVRATSTMAQQCPEGEISFIFVNSHPVFDTDDRDGGKESPWIYNVANKFHMETDEEFLRGELLFEVGDCYDSFRVAESERIIRRLGFIARIDISAIPQPDGSVHIVVDTQDKWTFQVTARARLDDGFEFNGLDVSEQNVAGKGIALGAYYNERRERRELGGGVQTQRFFGTRWNAHLQMGRTRVGDALQHRDPLFQRLDFALGFLVGFGAFRSMGDRLVAHHVFGDAVACIVARPQNTRGGTDQYDQDDGGGPAHQLVSCFSRSVSISWVR